MTNDVAITDPCVLFALEREARFFLRQFHAHQRFAAAPCWARFCGPSWLSVLVLKTGVGREHVEKALSWLLTKPRFETVPYIPRVVIAAGYAGALQSKPKVGDVILADSVIGTDGKCRPTTWPGELPPGEWRPPLHRGPIVTTTQIAGSAVEKRRLGEQSGALATDMEAAFIAEACWRAEIPFGCVRVISDELETSLPPELGAILSGSQVSPTRVMRAVVRAPGMLKSLWQLARNTRFASRQLANALGEVLTLTLPWGKEL
jgi:nucleoside phosphorylase